MEAVARPARRRLRDTPGFTALALVSLAIGMGFNILIFAFTSPALLKGLPYPQPDRLVDVTMAPPGQPEARGMLPPPLYVLLRDRTGAAFDAIGVFDAGRPANLAGDATAPAERLAGHRISASGMAALGAQPLHGRLPVLADEADTATPTLLLSYELWQRRFGGRPDVVNQMVQLDGQPTEILGVMPAGFGLLDNSSDAWFTDSFAPTTPAQETQHSLRAIGRLKSGASMDQARAAVKTALDEYATTFPDRDAGWTVELTPWREARFGGLRRPLTLVQLAVGGMLLLICVNVAVVLAARTSSMALAAPAGPGQLGAGAVLMNSLKLSFGAAAIGTVLVWIGLPALLEITPRVVPRIDEVALGAGVLAFAAVLAVVAGLVVGVVPALRASRVSRPTSRGWVGFALLVILLTAEMALAFVLGAGASLAYRGYSDLRGRDVGIDTSNLLSFDVHLPRAPYVVPNAGRAGSIELAEFAPAGAALYDRVLTAVRASPGVAEAAAVGTTPFAAAPFTQYWIGEGERMPSEQIAAQYLPVTENYFATMGIRVVRGRDFSPADSVDSPWVVLVNETLAKQQWPDGEAIGQKMALTFHPNDDEPLREVVGVVADVLPFRGASEVRPLIYVLHRQQAALQRASFEPRRTVMSFIVRTPEAPAAFDGAVRSVVTKVDQTTPVMTVKTMESYANAGQVTLLQYVATLLGIFAGIALVAAVLGAYALASYGAAHRQSAVMLLAGALVAGAVGVAVGFNVWSRLGSVIESFLTNLTVTPSDRLPLVIIGGVLLLMAAVACMIAASRRARVHA